MMSSFARSPLVLINGPNLSGPRLTFQPDCCRRHALPAWVARWWYVLANTTRVRWRDKEGECRSSISKVSSLPKSLPGLVRGLTVFYEEPGPWLGAKMLRKQQWWNLDPLLHPAFQKWLLLMLLTRKLDCVTHLCQTTCFRCSRFPGRSLIVFLPQALVSSNTSNMVVSRSVANIQSKTQL